MNAIRLPCLLALSGLLALATAAQAQDTAATAPESVAVVVGAASGLADVLIEELRANGWLRAGLGPSVLRSELAAAVAVSCVVQAAAGSGEGDV